LFCGWSGLEAEATMKRQSPILSATTGAAALLLTILAAYEPPSHEPWAQERLTPPAASVTAKAVHTPHATRSLRPHAERTARAARSPMLMVGISV
jgi:hypothetical protein